MISVSCVVPTFKRIEQTLKTLDLLLSSDGIGSTFTLELIVADSTPDESLKLAVEKQFGQKIVYTRPEKEGIAANKNAGANAAHHPILVFCDSDMEVETTSVGNAVSSLQKHEKAAMTGGTVLWRGGPDDGKKDRPRIEDRMIVNDGTTFIEALYSRFIATYKDVFLTLGGYDVNVFNMRGEGSDLSIRYWRAGLPLIYDDTITVHHIHDVPDAAAVRVDHPEWGIAKDMFLLAYKYGMFDDGYQNFPATVSIDFAPLGAEGYYRILQGMGKHYDLLISAKPFLDAYRAGDKPVYDFKFLEVFSNPTMFEECITGAAARLTEVRAQAFPSS